MTERHGATRLCRGRPSIPHRYSQPFEMPAEPPCCTETSNTSLRNYHFSTMCTRAVAASVCVLLLCVVLGLACAVCAVSLTASATRTARQLCSLRAHAG
eukprot:3376218-Rhodomonas_salina.3